MLDIIQKKSCTICFKPYSIMSFMYIIMNCRMVHYTQWKRHSTRFMVVQPKACICITHHTHSERYYLYAHILRGTFLSFSDEYQLINHCSCKPWFWIRTSLRPKTLVSGAKSGMEKTAKIHHYSNDVMLQNCLGSLKHLNSHTYTLCCVCVLMQLIV